MDRAAISMTVKTIRPAIDICGRGLTDGMPVKVKVRVHVTPSGRPDSTVADNGRVPTVAQCVAREMNKARFPRTLHGGTFLYPFVFGLDLE